MKKTIKVASISASVVAASAVLNANIAYAEENLTELTPAPAAVTETTEATEITQADVDEAKDLSDTAAKAVAEKEAVIKEADAVMEAVDKVVAQTEKQLEVAENADAIVEEATATITQETPKQEAAQTVVEETAVKQETAQKAVQEATKSIEIAKLEEDESKAAVSLQESVVAKAEQVAQTSQMFVGIKETLAKDEQRKININEQQLAETNQQIQDKETEIANYTPTVVTTEVGNKLTWAANPDPSKYEETVYSGERTVDVEITKEQAAQYEKDRTIVKEFDNRKLNEYFIKNLTELYKLNGYDAPVYQVSDKALATAEYRVEEMAKNDVLSHSTNHPDSDKYGENAGQMYSRRYTEESLAYDLALGWYDEYANLYGANYGHRAFMFAASGDGAVAVSKPAEDGKIYLAFVAYQWRDRFSGDGVTWSVRAENPGETVRLNGKKMVFLPKTTFRYVTKETIDNSATLQAELATLSQTKASFVAKQSGLETDLEKAQAEFVEATNKAKTDVANRDQAVKVLEEYKVAVTVKESNVVKAQNNLDAANADLARVDKALVDAKANLAAITNTIETAKADKEQAQALAGQADKLQAIIRGQIDRKIEAQGVKAIAASELIGLKEDAQVAFEKYQVVAEWFRIQNIIDEIIDNPELPETPTPNKPTNPDKPATPDTPIPNKPNTPATPTNTDNSQVLATPKVPKPADKTAQVTPVAKAATLPNTGTQEQTYLAFGAAATAILVGLGLVELEDKKKRA